MPYLENLCRMKMQYTVANITQGKEEGKDQESIQLSTTPDLYEKTTKIYGNITYKFP